MPVTGNTETTRPENRAFYPALDGLRAIAFLMVFAYHSLGMPWGWAGVNVFFVLSGFLITGILYDTRDALHRVRNFYVRRTLRIFPLYYGVLLLTLLAYPLAHWQWSAAWLLWPAYLGNFAALHPYADHSTFQLMADFQFRATRWADPPIFYLGHLWSLCVEEQFYLVWPWIVFWIKDRRKLIWICAAAVPGCLALRFAGLHLLPFWMLDHGALQHFTPFRVDDMLLGGLIALLLRGPMASQLLLWTRRIAPVVFVPALVWALYITPFRHVRSQFYPYPQGLLTWGFTAIAVLSGMAILLAIQPGSIVYRTLNLRPLRWMGRLSYGAYIIHDIFHEAVSRLAVVIFNHVGPHTVHARHVMYLLLPLPTSAISLTFALFLAWLSFRFYESPFLNLKERLTLR